MTSRHRFLLLQPYTQDTMRLQQRQRRCQAGDGEARVDGWR
jgi:hypothetical protein